MGGVPVAYRGSCPFQRVPLPTPSLAWGGAGVCTRPRPPPWDGVQTPFRVLPLSRCCGTGVLCSQEEGCLCWNWSCSWWRCWPWGLPWSPHRKPGCLEAWAWSVWACLGSSCAMSCFILLGCEQGCWTEACHRLGPAL